MKIVYRIAMLKSG